LTIARRVFLDVSGLAEEALSADVATGVNAIGLFSGLEERDVIL
jgi:hypothetical protein